MVSRSKIFRDKMRKEADKQKEEQQPTTPQTKRVGDRPFKNINGKEER